MSHKSLIFIGISFLIFFNLNFSLSGREKFSIKARGAERRIDHTDRSLLIECNYELDDSTLDKIILRNSSGSLKDYYTVESYSGDPSGKTAWIKFSDGFSLKESSKYFIDIDRGLRYVRRVGAKDRKIYGKIGRKKTFHFVTTSESPFSSSSTKGKKSASERTKLILISDIHIGGPRATAGNYNWFKDNVTEFIKFLEDVRTSQKVKELIIIGDLFDEWIMPMDVKPFDGGITSNEEFFKSIANSATMKPVFDKLNEIANAGEIKVVYVPGNHDMLMSEDIMTQIIPKAIWKGEKNTEGNDSGSGYYEPLAGIISVEHGHQYDFFNAPDSISHSGSLLPPGYFVSRMFATNMISAKRNQQEMLPSIGDLFFYSAWELVVWKIFDTIEPSVPPIITGIDGFTADYTYKQARDLYFDAHIGSNWQKRQEINKVYSPQSEISALLAGTGIFIFGDLELAASKQYFVPDRAKIVVFGHTHMAMLKGYNDSNQEIATNVEYKPDKDNLGLTKKIYANTGTWVNKSLVKKGYNTRTYVVINTDQTDSALLTVSLYQYNPDFDADNSLDDVSILLNEKNIHPDDDSTKSSTPLIP